MIRTLLVDDQKTFREFLKVSLESTPDIKVVGTASDGETAIEQVEIFQPDLVLMDAEMPDMDGITATRIICKRFPKVKVVIFSMHESDEYVINAIQAGAMGYLSKSTPAKEIKKAIKLVYGGSAQIGAGLLGKELKLSEFEQNLPPIDTTEPIKKKLLKAKANGSLAKAANANSLNNRFSLGRFNRSWKFYLAIWTIGNVVLWSTALLYLQFKAPSYVSSWKVALPGASSSNSINLPEIGQASSSSESPYNSQISDPRETYKLLLSSDRVIESAAEKLNITTQEFGKPRVQILDNTTLMELKIEGVTPQKTKQKALTLQKVFEAELDRLRKGEVAQQDLNSVDAIKDAETKLQDARKKLSDYQARSGLFSRQQLEDLSNNIEQLRREKAQLISQQRRTTGELNRLLRELDVSVEQASNILSLRSDRLFQQYLDNYSQISTELVNLEAKYQPSHPIAIAKREEQARAENALIQRAKTIVGQSVSLNTVKQLYLKSSQNSESNRADLLQESIALQSDAKGLEEQNQELERQILQLEAKLSGSSEGTSKLENLRSNLQIAEAVYSSLLSKLELSKSNASNTYPTISLLTQPNLPKEPSEPKTELILFGSAIGSLFLTTALLSLWWRDRHYYNALSSANKHRQNNHRALSSSDNNIIQKIIKK